MAAPPEITTVDLSGKFLLNRTLSDDTDELLRLQGVGWLTRKAISISSLTLSVNHYTDKDVAPPVEHINIDQTLTGGISGSSENRILDWTERQNEDHIFGAVLSKSRRTTLDEIDNEWLKEGWTEDTKKDGVIHTRAQSDASKNSNTWVAEQVWGFEEVNGERRYVRHIYFTGPADEVIKARLVYDYLGPA